MQSTINYKITLQSLNDINQNLFSNCKVFIKSLKKKYFLKLARRKILIKLLTKFQIHFILHLNPKIKLSLR